MRVNLHQLERKASPEKQAATERAVQATLDRMALEAIREYRHVSQAKLSSVTGIAQQEIARIESRTSVNLGTLDAYIRGLGGALQIHAIFPGQTIAIEVPHQERIEKAA